MTHFVVNTKEQQLAMLEEIGKVSFDDLFKSIPVNLRLKEDLHLPEGITEFEALGHMRALANENIQFKTILRGAGAYRHYIPSVVSHISAREEFVSAYTPYQAEISQGILQSIFEYQTMMCELTGMDASNASVYDGATAAAEAINMCVDKKHTKVLLASTMDPQVLETIETYYQFSDIELIRIPMSEGIVDLDELTRLADEHSACCLIQTPNYYGCLEDVYEIKSLLNKMKLVMICNPISLGLLEAPGNYGADIVVGDGQPLGMALAFGGPYLGFMTTKEEFARRLPGRIVGETQDIHGQRAYTLTLQAREQHIRREKATSSICSNQALCALTAAIYMSSVGPTGLGDIAEQCFHKAHYFQSELAKIGFTLKYQNEFFHEFVTNTTVSSAILLRYLEDHGILGGLALNDREILWCVSEVVSKVEMDQVIRLISEVSNHE